MCSHTMSESQHESAADTLSAAAEAKTWDADTSAAAEVKSAAETLSAL